tara:strand:- start:44273 stop:45880 length:1608 start_codon:yes stop_codon:yes gene_type:complete
MGIVHSRTYLRDRQEVVHRLTKWQDLVNLVAKIFDGSASLVCQLTASGFRPVVSSDQESNPFPIGVTFPKDAHTFCDEVISREAPLYIPNAPEDPQWANNLVWVEHGFRSYYGVPLYWPDGQIFGTISIMDLSSTDYEEPFIYWLTCFRDLVEADLISAAQYLNKSEFLAGVSHELRTPMNGIVGMADALLGSTLNENQKLEVETIRDCAETLMSLLNDILDISKIEAGHLDIDIQTFDVRAVMEHIERLWRTRSEEKNLKFAVSIDDDVPQKLDGDVNRIKQVLFNLISNAIKYTESGGVEVRLASRGYREGSLQLRVEVEDSGDGLNREMQESVFQRFIQADTSIGRPESGIGLGLAISRNLVQMMNGSIGVDSEPGVGSTFYFELPLGIPHRAARELMSPEILEVPEANADIAILIVEDNHINLRVLEAYLMPYPFKCEAAVNGAEAVDLVKRRRFDIILMDIQMPVMDGIEATREIRALGGWCSNIPIIAVTANAMAGDRERYLNAGMDDYVPKPIDKSVLIKAINRHIQK